MGLFNVGLEPQDRALLERLVSLLETVVSGKELVIRMSFDRKVDDIKKSYLTK